MEIKLSVLILVLIAVMAILILIGVKNKWSSTGIGISLLTAALFLGCMILLGKVNPVYTTSGPVMGLLTLGNTRNAGWMSERSQTYYAASGDENTGSVFGNSAPAEEYVTQSAQYVEDADEIANIKYVYNKVELKSVDDHGAATSKTHLVQNLNDGDIETNWQEELEGNGEGTILSFYFDEPTDIEFISVYNGRQLNDKKFKQNKRIEKIYIEDNFGNSMTVTLQDLMGEQMMRVTGFYGVSEMHWTIESVYSEGSIYEDTCLSEVAFYTN